jgi:hypothetical protein
MNTLTPSEILEAIYASEINFELTAFWAAGFHWRLGDAMNGYHAEGHEETFSEAVNQLAQAAGRHFPSSAFVLGGETTSQVEKARADNPVECRACLAESGRLGPERPPIKSMPEFDLLFAARRKCPKCGADVVFKREGSNEA